MIDDSVSTTLQRLSVEQVIDSGWPELYQRLEHPRCHQHPDWLLAADEHLLGQSLQMACISLRGKPALLLPWQSRSRSRRAAAPCHDHLTLGDALFDPELTAQQRTQCLQQALSVCGNTLWDWRIGNVPDRSYLVHTSRDDPQWSRRLTRHSAWFDLASDGAPGTGKLKRNLRRLRRQLGDQGELRAEWHVTEPALTEALGHFMTLEDAGWKGHSGLRTAIADSAALRGFYEALLHPRFPGLQAMIGLLWLDDRCIAAQYGLITGRCLSLLKITYDEAYSHYSPGSLLLQDTADLAMSQALQTLSLVTSPAWAQRWHPKTEPVWHLAWYSRSTGGRTLRTLERLREQARHRLKNVA